jgi:dolichol-phosphate mannosyltransferase
MELLLKLSRLGARFVEIPLALRYDRKQGVSKMRIAQTVRRTVSVLGRHHFRR